MATTTGNEQPQRVGRPIGFTDHSSTVANIFDSSNLILARHSGAHFEFVVTDMSTQVDTDDNRRKRTRHNVMKRGTLLMDAGTLTLPCTVRNLSRDGALIFAEQLPDDRPRDFILLIDSLQLQVSCLVKWIAEEDSGCDIGVRFLSRWREFTPVKPQPFAMKLKKNLEQWVKN